MDTLLIDVKLAARMLWRSPRFTLIAVTALGLGIGANTAIFTIVDKVLLNPLPYPQSDRIVVLERVYQSGRRLASVPVPNYNFWQSHSASILEDISAYSFVGIALNLAGGDRPEQVRAMKVSKNYFRLFGATPILGRTFSAQEDRPGGPPVAVISDALWRRRFGAAPSAMGRALVLNSERYTVVGVLPKHFHPQINDTEVWLPLQAAPNSNSHANYLHVAGRLKPGISLGQANARMKVEAAAFRAARSSKFIAKDETADAKRLLDVTVGSVRPMLLILMSAVALVLLIACANVANLLLAKASARQRELAIRGAIGAGRARIVRQLLTESVLLAAVAAGVGLLIGTWGAHGLMAMAPLKLPQGTDLARETPLNGTVLLVTIGAALLTAILFGLLPAWHASKPDLNMTLQEAGGRAGIGLRQNKARSLLVIAEAALSVMLLVGAILMIRTFSALERVDPGFDPHHVLTMSTGLAGKRWTSTAAVEHYERDVIQRLESTPGVSSATSLIELPATGDNIGLTFVIGGRPLPAGRPFQGVALYRPISPHYFQVFRIPLLSGRLFAPRDTARSAPVALINEVMAKKYWKSGNPVGQQLTIGRSMGPQFADSPRTIVGVVASVRETGLNRDPPPVIYIPSAQVPNGLTRFANGLIPRWWAVRTRGDPLAMSAAIKAQFNAVDNQVAVANFWTMDQALATTTDKQSFSMQLMGTFAVVALLLAAIGIVGVVAYMVEQRTAEIGVRMALGAPARRIIRLVAGRMMLLTSVGIVVGFSGALALTKLMQGMLYDVKPADPLTFATAGLTLIVVAAAACWIPAKRATRIDPVTVLRQ